MQIPGQLPLLPGPSLNRVAPPSQPEIPLATPADGMQWSVPQALSPTLAQASLAAAPSLNLDQARSSQEVVQRISRHILEQPCITEGLDQAYSPNHPNGMTTRVHIETQMKMVNHYVGAETRALEAFQAGDYAELHKMVDNPDLNEKLRVSENDLKELLEPLRQGLTRSDWKVLTVVAGYHDLGKMSPEWGKKSGMDLKGVEWIAHDYDSETMLRNNPALLQPYELTEDEREKALALSRLHSLPGQFFFGEGNLSAYGPLFKTAERDQSENVLKLARIHGALDVMSALNHKLVKPVLSSHLKLRDFISDAFANQTPLGMKFRQTAVAELQKASDGPDGPALKAIERDFGVGPVALNRLQKLMGNDIKPHHILQALEKLDHETIYEFHEATDREQTWFGTYVANSFGSGMAKALKVGKPDALAEGHEVVQAMVKMLACSARFHRRIDMEGGARQEWALGSLGPSLAVAGSAEGARAVLRETEKIYSVDQGIRMMTGPGSPLTLRGGQTGVEIGWKPASPS